jgi:hypothetical protein
MLSVGSALTPQALVRQLRRDSGAAPLEVESLWVWDNVKGKWYYYSPALADQGAGVLSSYTLSNGLLDFATDGKLIEANSGIWVLLK